MTVSEKERVRGPLPEADTVSEKERDAAPLAEGERDPEGLGGGEALAEGLRVGTSVAFAVRLLEIVSYMELLGDTVHDAATDAVGEGWAVYEYSASSTGGSVTGTAGAKMGSPSLYACTLQSPKARVPVRYPVLNVPG